MRTLKVIVFTVLVAGLVVFLVPKFRSLVSQLLSFSECARPMAYKLGKIDQKFNLSKEVVVSDLQSAAEIWSKAYGKTLLTNSPTAVLTVNFVYDQRSALNTNINQLQYQIDKKGTTLQQQIASYESDLAAFKLKLEAYNALVLKINQSGGASKALYDSLVSQRVQLTAEGDSLNVRASQLNLVTNDFNSNVDNLNQNITQFNEEIEKTPEEGLYNGNDSTITIYFASNRQELIHTLAHEFGHALGIQHTQDPQSIMYPDTSSFLTATSEDKQQLAYVCREQPLISHLLEEFSTWVHVAFGSLATR
jgi:chromosome segregation ATPase